MKVSFIGKKKSQQDLHIKELSWLSNLFQRPIKLQKENACDLESHFAGSSTGRKKTNKQKFLLYGHIEIQKSCIYQWIGAHTHTFTVPTSKQSLSAYSS